MKNKIIYETYNYPELFIPLKEAEKAEENTTLFMEGILSKLLINNKISVAIKKDYIKENEKIVLPLVQAISTGDAYKKIITITYDINEKKNPSLLIDEEVQKEFLNNKKKEYSHLLKIPEKDLNIMKIGFKSYTIEISNYKNLKEKDKEKKEEEKKIEEEEKKEEEGKKVN